MTRTSRATIDFMDCMHLEAPVCRDCEGEGVDWMTGGACMMCHGAGIVPLAPAETLSASSDTPE